MKRTNLSGLRAMNKNVVAALVALALIAATVAAADPIPAPG